MESMEILSLLKRTEIDIFGLLVYQSFVSSLSSDTNQIESSYNFDSSKTSLLHQII
ncbi:hypothetical protein Fmac_013474 [Flemingia macrophylla]|uniref:Maturase K n=1 Tax=Flemingia macrophylla TaxID=520843 RepID=A0ABD1MT91_9FABA